MKAATISETKNNLSAVLSRVKAGEAVVITDRGVPVARLEPVPAEILDPPTVRLPDGVSSLEVVLDERRSGW
mgnify:CR=1 FL=1